MSRGLLFIFAQLIGSIMVVDMKKIPKKFRKREEWKRYHDYRSYWDLYAIILSLCLENPQTVSYIARYGTQKIERIKHRIEFLLEKNWLQRITEHSENVKYKTTPKGIKFLDLYLDLWNHTFERDD